MKNIAYILILFNMIHLAACQSPGKNASADLFEKDNLVAWCIVPFDAAERGPEARAKMLGDLNGMRVEGPKIITLGEGDREPEMLRIIHASGFTGPIGILGHTEGEDIRIVLERNLEGLANLKREL